MILAGGRVDDLKVLTFSRPKSALPFGGLYRVIDFPMSNLMHSGIEKVGILSQYKPFDLMEHIGSGESWDMTGRDRFAAILPPFKGLSTWDWYRGTADAVYQNLDFLRTHRPDLILVLSGDHIYKMDYREILEFHQSSGADTTVAFAQVGREGAKRFGMARIEEGNERGGRVLEYAEKTEAPHLSWASLTIYVFSPYALFEALQANTESDSHEFGRDIIPWLLANDYSVYGYKHRGYWGYAGNVQEYWQTNMDLISDPPRLDMSSWRVCTNLSHGGTRDRQPALLGPTARIRDSLVHSGCRVQGTVERSILFPGARVDSGAIVRDSILFSNSIIKQNARLDRTITDDNAVIGAGAQIGEADGGDICIVGMSARVPKEVKIAAGAIIYPDLGPAQFAKTEFDRGEVIQ